MDNEGKVGGGGGGGGFEKIISDVLTFVIPLDIWVSRNYGAYHTGLGLVGLVIRFRSTGSHGVGLLIGSQLRSSVWG